MHRLACCAALLMACEAGNDSNATGEFIIERAAGVDCTGAFTPNSEVCWNAQQIEEGPIAADPVQAEGDIGEVEGQDRCALLSIAPEGTAGTLTVSLTTTPLDGSFGPRNCGAVWIEDSNRQFVRTLELWTEERAQSLTVWMARACHETDKTVTKPEVITSATLKTHKAHTSKWDGMDFRGRVMPDGEFTLWMQVTESEFIPQGPYQKIPFVKGSKAWVDTPAPIEGFADIKLSYEPGAPLETVRSN